MRKLYWIIWILLTAALYIFENDAAARTMLVASLVIPSILIATAGIFVGKVNLLLEFPDAGIKETVISGSVVITSVAWIPPLRFSCVIVCRNLFTGEKQTEKLHVVLPSKFKRIKNIRESVLFDLRTEYCGNLHISAEHCRLQDMFGLSSWKLIAPTGTDILVPPEVFNVTVTQIEDSGVVVDSDEYSPLKPGFDPSETFAIREYIPGDPIKNIHWKLSRKTDRVMVRELGLPIVNQTIVIFENAFFEDFELSASASTPGTADVMAEIFFSVSFGLISHGIAHTIGWRETESGVFVTHKICLAEDIDAVMSEFLSNAATPGQSTKGFLLNAVAPGQSTKGFLLNAVAPGQTTNNFLPNPVTPGQSTNESCSHENQGPCAYAHVVVICAYIPPNIDLMYNGNRVTVIYCAENDAENASGSASEMIYQIPFTTYNYRDELCALQL